MITLDQELVGKLAKDVKDASEKEDSERIGYKAIPYAQKTRLDRLKADGKNIVEEDVSDDDEEDDDDDLDGEARKRRQEAKVDKSDAKKRARGRNSTLKKMLRKRKRNVVDPQTVRSYTLSVLVTIYYILMLNIR
jgi:U3 small nucleolar RNA-associated protein 7